MTRTVTLFGATGGCTNAALVIALNAGYSCTALARTPQKLRDMLTAAGVSASTIDSHLRIVQGDVKDSASVSQALSDADMIVSGVGFDIFAKNPDTKLCQTATKTILDALRASRPANKPHYVVISTTGISDGPRDVPVAFLPMYHILLKTPHVDKRAMEDLLVEEGTKNEEERVISGWTAVRPSFLANGDEKQTQNVKVGTESKPAIGYVINRKDVGRWIFDNLIEGDAKFWDGKKPSITL